MERPPKRQRLQIEVMLRTETEDEEADADSRSRINIEDVSVHIAEPEDSESEVMDNNNYLGEEEEAAQLEDPVVEEIDRAQPENEEDEDEDEEEFAPCDWCKGTVRTDEDRELLMIFDEDVCRNCVRESDLQMTSSGQYDYPADQFEDSENASSSGGGGNSDTTVIVLTDSDDEAEREA